MEKRFETFPWSCSVPQTLRLGMQPGRKPLFTSNQDGPEYAAHDALSCGLETFRGRGLRLLGPCGRAPKNWIVAVQFGGATLGRFHLVKKTATAQASIKAQTKLGRDKEHQLTGRKDGSR
jgi:hypothetical protein